MSKVLFLLVILVCAFAAFGQSNGPEITQGSLFAYDKKGKELGDCPLKNTSVKTDISGFLARVHVTQEFENGFAFPIEAVYTFPLSQNGAVDDMTMTIGNRVIRGKIMKREEARAVYEQAKSEGKTASLLDQERPNIFTQSVANILPGDKVVIEISYVETLRYEDGAYEFVFPMTVAPRYIPASVKDTAKISPPVAATRNGSDISVEVNLNAGVPIEEIRSTSHDIKQINYTPNTSKVTLKDERTIPNKDFILRYDVTGGKIEDAVLTHRDERGGFFTLILQPPDKFTSEDRTPKEIVFVLDTSGSMSGFPIEKAKEAMKMSIDGLYPDDTFNVITFAGDTAILFDGPVPATEANVEEAKEFIESRQGMGGTEMMKAIKAALDPSDAKDHIRIVCFMTDGEVGNDDEIIAEVQRHPQARVFSFGIGSSVNRYLLDKIAEQGRGEAEYVSLTDDGSKAAKKFYERVRTPLLTDLSIDWNGLPVSAVYPSRLTDLFSAKPVIVNGRFEKAASGTIKLHGKVAGQPYEREIAINLPDKEAANDSLASLWARTRIDELSSDKLRATNPKKVPDYEKEIITLGLEFRLMTDFTSFVAIEDRVVNQNGKPVTVQVPVELPEGMNRATTVGDDVVKVDAMNATVNVTASTSQTIQSSSVANLPVNGRQTTSQLVTITPGISGGGGGRTETVGKSKSRRVRGSGNGVGYGQGSASGGGTGNGYGTGSGNDSGAPPAVATSAGVLNGKALSLPKPIYPAAARTVNADGVVAVEIVIDPAGNVVSATATSGNPLLQATAVQAAQQARFSPTLLSGVPITVKGIISYNFTDPSKNAIVAVGAVTTEIPTAEAVKPPTAEMLRDRRLKEKLHTWLYPLITRIGMPNPTPTENEARFVRDGKATIQIQLSLESEAVIQKLKVAGFEIIDRKGA
jgi:Ca-activated chloride channel family protein